MLKIHNGCKYLKIGEQKTKGYTGFKGPFDEDIVWQCLHPENKAPQAVTCPRRDRLPCPFGGPFE